MHRHHLLSHAIGLLLLAANISLCPAQTPFTYQGHLENSGAPFTGTVQLRLGLYTSLSGGAALRQEVIPDVTVTAGSFTATPLTFVPSDFPGAARYLEIEISSDAGATYTALTPRQQITWVPYAMTASSASSLTGTLPASRLTGTLNPSILGTGTIGGTVTFNPPLGPPFSVEGNTGLVKDLNADRLDGLSSGDFLRVTGGTMSGDLSVSNAAKLNFGDATRQMLNLYNADYGIGVQANTLYTRSANDWSWHRLGTHSDVRNSPGTGGSEAMRLGNDYALWLRPNATAGPRGRLIFGDLTSGGFPKVFIGERQGTLDVDDLELTGRQIRVSSFGSSDPSITFGQTTGQHLVLYENTSDTYGIGVQSYYQYFRTGDSFAWYKDGVHSDTAGSPGAGGSTLMTLSATGTLALKGSANGFYTTNRNDSSQEWAMYSRNSGGVGQLAFWSNGGGDVAAFSPNGDFFLTGQMSTTVLTIRGGADVAEPFEMTEPDALEPGCVVVIDDENPGKLKLSTQSCDDKVAGIISGAGGVKPGLRLHQEGVMEGDHHVALSGRVYVKADAEFGAIRPGDLMTTSTTPGHAMKVKSREDCQGAILGKAMSKLEDGKGLVLVLVTLQ